jgi:hypothetical protein
MFTPPAQIVVNAPNFVYQDPILEKFNPVQDMLSNVLQSLSSLGKCFCCTLTVLVPKSQQHPYWAQEPEIITHPLGCTPPEAFAWDALGESVSFTLERHGPTEDTAKLYATHCALHIIQSVRDLLRAPLPTLIEATETKSVSSVETCPALQLGQTLHKMWRANPNWFEIACPSDPLMTLDGIECAFPLLTTSYKVVLPHVRTEGRPFSTFNAGSLHLQRDCYRVYHRKRSGVWWCPPGCARFGAQWGRGVRYTYCEDD